MKKHKDIKTIKTIKDIKTGDLARFLGKTNGFASQLKSGYRLVPVKSVKPLCKEYGFKPQELRPDIF